MRTLVVRLGAYGDCIIITPLLRYLKERGYEVYLLTSEHQGREIFGESNPRIDKIIFHKKDSIGNDKLGDYFEEVKKSYECDSIIDLCESIECRLALHPIDPRYKYTKPELKAICDKNYYEETMRLCPLAGNGRPPQIYLPYDKKKKEKGKSLIDLNPEMFFSEKEENIMAYEMKQHIGKFKIVWGLSGSSRQKCYPTPHMASVINKLNDKYKGEVVVFTVGDYMCRILESPFGDIDFVHARAGVWSMRQSILACKYADLVVSPDTGLLHGAGCFDTPKIGLLTNTTIENITKHFVNDYSLEAEDVSCAPCFHLVYNAQEQAQLADDYITPLCMAYGIHPERVFNRIQEVKNGKR